jgi:hypothetical protein
MSGRQERTRLRKELVLPDFDLRLALCGQTDPEIFFPNTGDQGAAKKAKEICRQCEVQKDCLAWALANEEEFGVWGGLTPKERRALKQRGRAIKRPIPIVPR